MVLALYGTICTWCEEAPGIFAVASLSVCQHLPKQDDGGRGTLLITCCHAWWRSPVTVPTSVICAARVHSEAAQYETAPLPSASALIAGCL